MAKQYEATFTDSTIVLSSCYFRVKQFLDFRQFYSKSKPFYTYVEKNVKALSTYALLLLIIGRSAVYTIDKFIITKYQFLLQQKTCPHKYPPWFHVTILRQNQLWDVPSILNLIFAVIVNLLENQTGSLGVHVITNFKCKIKLKILKQSPKFYSFNKFTVSDNKTTHKALYYLNESKWQNTY